MKSLIKAVLFDVDGVVLLPRKKYFSQRLREDGYEPDTQKINYFFNNQYKKVIIGKADLKKELSFVLNDLGWKGTVDELLEYWFSYENKINKEVIDFAQELRLSGVKCYLASDHSLERKNVLMNEVGLSRYFDGAFFSVDFGYTKEEREYYDKVVSNLGLASENIVFVDDDIKNVNIAKSILPKAVLFTSIEDLRKSIYV